MNVVEKEFCENNNVEDKCRILGNYFPNLMENKTNIII